MNLHVFASALATARQLIAAFAVHAMWQIPLLAGAAWSALRVGKPAVRIAHRIWCGTLFLCVLLPGCSTLIGRSAALEAARERAEVRLQTTPYAGTWTALHREGRWTRFLHRHLGVRGGLRPVALTLSPQWEDGISLGYALVTLLFALRLILSWLHTRGMARRASADGIPLTICGCLLERCGHLAIPAPACRLSAEVMGPALAGVLRPVLLLPENSCDLSRTEVDAVLAHELAHLRRRDPLLHAVCAWLLLPVSFHPAAFWIAVRIRQTREMACDAEASADFRSVAGYADALLRMAERAAPATVPRWAAPGFFNTGLLGMFNKHGTMEERMQMLMNGNKDIVRGRAVRAAGCLAIAAAAVLVTGMLQVQPALAHEGINQQTTAASQTVTPQEQVTSPDADSTLPRLLSGEHAREQLRRAQRQLSTAQQEATSDEERHRIATARSALRAAEQALASADDSAGRRTTIEMPDLSNLDLPSLDELNALSDKQREAVKNLQLRFSSPEFKATMDRAMRQQVKALTAEQEKMLDNIRSGEMAIRVKEQTQQIARLDLLGMPFVAPAEGQPLKIAPGVLAGNNTHKENPVYPVEAKGKAVQGAVVLHVIVDETGKVEQASMISSPDPLLTESAISAVKQWIYKPFLLNGSAVPVESTVTVTYSLSR